ncbi:M55 family metallopeptidase [Micromonospora sp. CPCC 205558]|uniref:M55 family metallopeptidase n=1 Tax=Micromonospora sp. CPCC 205558 TaxID=3122403 RepID=UPI002FEE8075
MPLVSTTETARSARWGGAARGQTPPAGMLAGLDEHTDAVLFVGYHAGAGPAVLAHTMSDAILDVRVPAWRDSPRSSGSPNDRVAIGRPAEGARR